jgi:AraC-like DNA-binding protein
MVFQEGFDLLIEQPLRFEYQSGGIAKLERSHSTGWRILPCLMLSQAGRGEEHMELPDGHSYTAETGALFVVPAGLKHCITVTTKHETRIWAHVNYFFLDSLDLFSFVEIPLMIRPDEAQKIGQLLKKQIAMWPRDDFPQDRLLQVAERNAFGFELLALLSPFCRVKEASVKNLKQLERFRPVLEYMGRNLAKPLTRDMLAGLANLSPAPFHIAFKEVFGKPPMHFLRDIRMKSAQRMLLSDNTPVAEIAEQCGYSDQFIFSKAFKKKYGVSPANYRLKQRIVESNISI